MVDMIANNHIFELSVPAYARAFLFRESSVGGISYKAKKRKPFTRFSPSSVIAEGRLELSTLRV